MEAPALHSWPRRLFDARQHFTGALVSRALHRPTRQALADERIELDWIDDAGAHREAHVCGAGQPAEWDIKTGRNVQTRWVEFEPIAGR